MKTLIFLLSLSCLCASAQRRELKWENIAVPGTADYSAGWDLSGNATMIDRKKFNVDDVNSLELNKTTATANEELRPAGPNGVFAGAGSIDYAVIVSSKFPNNTVVHIECITIGIKTDGTGTVMAKRKAVCRKNNAGTWTVDSQEASVIAGSTPADITSCQIHINGGNVQFEVVKANATSYRLESWTKIEQGNL
jgi:hypothetical protein